MSRFYSNENFPLATVRFLRAMGHDVLTTADTGKSNLGIPDEEVLEFASEQGRCVLTHNRKDFKRLHQQSARHAGIIICTTDENFKRLATHIHEQSEVHEDFSSKLLKVYPGS